MIHVLGAGSLGLLWIARLQEAGLDCRLLLRDQGALQRWRAANNQLQFVHHNGEQRHLQINCEVAASASAPIAIVIVATKAHSVASALESIRHRLTANSQILLLQNGLGSQQQVTSAFSEQHVLYASVTDGAWQPAPQQLIWAGKGLTLVGDAAARPAPAWLQQLDNTIDWQWHEQILAVLWRKLAINCAINPFTLLFDCANGQVPRHAGAWLGDCIEELQLLLAAQGVDDSSSLNQQVHDIIHRTASNSSSMRQDLHAGRRTELDYILGYACRAAERSGQSAPALHKLLSAARERLREQGLPLD